MTDLIKIENKKGIETVNARELWEFLESKQDFSNWIKNRIEKYDFIENIDYVTLNKKRERQILIEYHITLDMAKELSMVEHSSKGKEARLYFINCEKELKNKNQLRIKSKEYRNKFTDTLKNHGYTKAHEYIQTTLQMKGVLGIEHKKPEMTEKELKLITACEMIAEVNLSETKAKGYYQVNPICLNSALAIQNITRKRIPA